MNRAKMSKPPPPGLFKKIKLEYTQSWEQELLIRELEQRYHLPREILFRQAIEGLFAAGRNFQTQSTK